MSVECRIQTVSLLQTLIVWATDLHTMKGSEAPTGLNSLGSPKK
jgi:hypothetical protein